MRANSRYIFPCLLVKNGTYRYFAVVGCFGCRMLRVSGIVLAISLSLTSLAPAADEAAARSAENIDARWLPWIGSWRLISDAVRENDKSAKENYLVDIHPGDDGKSIVMKSFQDEKLLLETRIAADGSRQQLEDTRCSGWYKYSWSDTGKRLLFESESGCPAELPRIISGISIITENRDWFDIQLLRSGEDLAVSVQKYRSISEIPNTATKAGPGPTGAPRYLAGTSLSIDEVIELNRKVPSELLETAIAELQKPFKINSSTLKRLSDAGVRLQVVDLMVALSFPDKFTVNRQRIAPTRQAEAAPAYYGPSYIWLPFGYWSIYGPYSNWYWGSSIYSQGYWGPGWDIWPRGYPYGGYDGRGDDSGGRLINGRGYSRVEPVGSNAQPRYAQPRNNSESSSGGGYQNSTGSSSAPPAASNNSSSGTVSSSPSGSSGSSGGSAPSVSPSASPGGYHSGSGGDGGKAKPRD